MCDMKVGDTDRKSVSFIVDAPYMNNKIFDFSQSSRVKYFAIKQRFENLGYEVGTHDVVSPECANILIYLDRLPSIQHREFSSNKYLIAIESPIIKPEIYDGRNHSEFSLVFTWNDDWVDGVRYYKIRYALDFKHKMSGNYGARQLSSMVFSNRLSSSQGELYSFRRTIIRWFELHNQNDFHLYGRGWGVRKSKNRILSAILGFQVLGISFGKVLGGGFKSYRGEVIDKHSVISGYKFVFCPENVSGWNGYVTEKILDAISVGAVPIYSGAPNISKYIPENMFISFNEGDSFEDLYLHLLSYKESDFIAHKKRCEEFFSGKGVSDFGIEQFVDSVCSPILRDVGG
tara:strand:+ start:10129 stop:11163 length:1035 start_codon:yes stop_codon:yes gene_type:complete